MKKFSNSGAAIKYIIPRVDVAVKNRTVHLRKGVTVSTSVTKLAGGKFTNIYDACFDPKKVTLKVGLGNERTSLYDIIRNDNHILAAYSGGFSYLTDDPNTHPRHPALNLAIKDGEVMSLPVVDREALLIINGQMSVCFLRAIGIMEINGESVTWSGSLSDHHTSVKVYGNGNSVINHANEGGGSRRVLNEDSRFTPVILGDEEVDVGFMKKNGDTFVASEVSTKGQLDIFAFDIVLRCPKRIGIVHTDMVVKSIDSLSIDATIQSAMSVGPLLDTANFDDHLINKDASLGTKAPFANRRAARAVIYETADGLRHLRLFDGRPGSDVFSGVTPSEAVCIINSETKVIWGCFLDGGQTAKLCVRRGLIINSFGNKHYIGKLPKNQGVVWLPKTGRSLVSIITLN